MKTANTNGRVGAAEAERVLERDHWTTGRRQLFLLVGHNAHTALGRVEAERFVHLFDVYRRRQDVLVTRESGQSELDGAGRAQTMTKRALEARHVHNTIIRSSRRFFAAAQLQQSLECHDFGQIARRRRGRVRVHVVELIDTYARVVQRLLHASIL